MRIYHIALFCFILQSVAAILVQFAPEFGIGAVIYTEDPTSGLQELENSKNQFNQVTTQASGSNFFSDALGWFYQQVTTAAFKLFSSTFIGKWILWIPFFFIAIGVPVPFAILLFGVTTTIQIVGFYQFFTGRDMEK